MPLLKKVTVTTYCYELLMLRLPYNYLAIMSLLQKDVMTNLLWLCSPSITLPICLSNPLFGKAPPLSYEKHIFPQVQV